MVQAQKYFAEESTEQSMPTFLEIVGRLYKPQLLETLGLQVHLAQEVLNTFKGDLQDPGSSRRTSGPWPASTLSWPCSKFRFQRMLWLWRGLPGIFARLLHQDEAIVQDTLKRMKQAYLPGWRQRRSSPSPPTSRPSSSALSSRTPWS